MPVGPETGISGTKTGFFHVEKIEGRDWIVDPVGRAVYLTGIDWCMPQGMFCEALGYAPYGRTVKEKYASRDDWAAASAARLSSWGFDFLAVGSGPQMRYRSLAHADGSDALYFSTHLCSGDDPDTWISPYRHAPGTAFPNVFHPDFEKRCDELARKRCAHNIGDPWLVGYFIDNELRWWGLGDSATGLFDLVRTLPKTHTARQALERFVVEHGGGSGAEPTLSLKRDFVALIAEKYFSTLCAAIRKADPDHLILGCRFAGLDFAPAIVGACGRHCDVVSLNVYPWADLDRGVVMSAKSGATLADAMGEFHEKSGEKPLLLTEWSFPALDSGLPCTYGAGQRLETQAERTEASELMLRTLLSLPFFVGHDYFMWQDDPALGFNKFFHENCNYGLVNVNDEPYAELVEMFARVHANAAALRADGAVAPAARSGAPATAPSERERFFAEAAERTASNAGFVAGAQSPAAVCFSKGADGSWLLSNGLVRISGRIGGARMADEIAWGGNEPAGRWSALLQWRLGDVTQWTEVSRVASVDFASDPTTGVGTVTIRAEGSATGASAPVAFAITDKLSLAPGSADVLAEIVLLENIGKEPIDVEYVFFRPFAAEAAPTAVKSETPPNLWHGPVEGWWGLSGGSRFGIVSRDPGVVSAKLWMRKEDATQHPDVRCADRAPFRLGPGETWTPRVPTGARLLLRLP